MVRRLSRFHIGKQKRGEAGPVFEVDLIGQAFVRCDQQFKQILMVPSDQDDAPGLHLLRHELLELPGLRAPIKEIAQDDQPSFPRIVEVPCVLQGFPENAEVSVNV
jgi:hypothetical protein